MENKRFMIIVLGSSKGIDIDLNEIADGEHGVNYVDGNGIFIGTFYSHYNTFEIYELLSDRPAFLLFDITNGDNNIVNLPSKYYKGLFPEINDILPKIKTEKVEVTNKEIGTLTNIDQILDKLRENNFDTSCLTEKENKILKNY
jgi:hypothetical protein